MRTLLSLAVVAVACLSSAACGEPGARDAEVVRTDSAGVEIVTSPGVDRELAWTLEPVFRLGGAEEGPASFTSLGEASVDADGAGNVYVLDTDAGRVVVFGPDGTHLRSMGSEGGGPGEFQFPIVLSVSPGGVAAVFDIGKRALVSFAGDGTLLPQMPFPFFAPPRTGGHFERGDGGFVVHQAVADEGDGRGAVLRSWATGAADTIEIAESPIPEGSVIALDCAQLRLPPLFTPVIRWDAAGERIAVTASDTYEVDIVSTDGTLLRRVRRDIAAVEADRSIAAAEVPEGMTVSVGGGVSCSATPEAVVEAVGFEATVPAIRHVALEEDGTLWVERWEPGRTADRGDGPIDVFGPDGAYLGTLPGGTPFPLALIPDDRIAISERDELDIERLVVMRLAR